MQSAKNNLPGFVQATTFAMQAQNGNQPCWGGQLVFKAGFSLVKSSVTVWQNLASFGDRCELHLNNIFQVRKSVWPIMNRDWEKRHQQISDSLENHQPRAQGRLLSLPVSPRLRSQKQFQSSMPLWRIINLTYVQATILKISNLNSKSFNSLNCWEVPENCSLYLYCKAWFPYDRNPIVESTGIVRTMQDLADYKETKSNQRWISYAGTHVPMFVHKLGLIKPRQTYPCPKLWAFLMKISLGLFCVFRTIAIRFVLNCGLFQEFWDCYRF